MPAVNELMNRKLTPKVCALVTILVLAPILTAIAYHAFQPSPIHLAGTTLELVPLGEIDPALPKAIARETAAVYKIPCRVAEKPMALPPSSYDKARRQYVADRLLLALKPRPTPPNLHRIAITEADITTPGLNFLFGLADLPGHNAVMSVSRLRLGVKKDAFAGSMIQERAAKVAVHELGHTYGFEHCPNDRCVMSFSNTQGAVDASAKTFCERCRKRVK